MLSSDDLLKLCTKERKERRKEKKSKERKGREEGKGEKKEGGKVPTKLSIQWREGRAGVSVKCYMLTGTKYFWLIPNHSRGLSFDPLTLPLATVKFHINDRPEYDV
jgi:hypothetical protein